MLRHYLLLLAIVSSNGQVPSVYTSCGGDVRYYASNITYPASGEYGRNEDCIWNFTAPVPVKIQFQRFDTESDNDGVYVNELYFSGGDIPSDIGPLIGSIVVRFISDNDTSGQGFSVIIDTIRCVDNPCQADENCTDTGATHTYKCDGRWVYSFCGGDVAYPSVIRFPASGYYAELMYCIWKIAASVPVTIHFQRFETEEYYDYLYVNAEQYHGNITPSDIGPLHGSIKLRFISDTGVSYAGFSAIIDPVTCADNPCQSNEECIDTRYGPTHTYQCNCKLGYIRSGTSCQVFSVHSSCGGDVPYYASEIRYPASGDYETNENCTWYINAPVPVRIHFQHFDTVRDRHYLYVNGEPYHGSSTPAAIAPLRGLVTLIFTSDFFVGSTGFSVIIDPITCADNPCHVNEDCNDTRHGHTHTYQCNCKQGYIWNGTSCEAIPVYSSCGGDVSYYPSVIRYPASGYYQSYQNCTWNITAPVPVKIHFQRLEVEPIYDYIHAPNGEVYSGFSAPSDLGPLRGSTTLIFISDHNIVDAGFSAIIDPIRCADNPCQVNEDCNDTRHGPTDTYQCNCKHGYIWNGTNCDAPTPATTPPPPTTDAPTPATTPPPTTTDEKAGTSTELGDDGFTVECDETHVTGAWEKDLFGSNNVEISMRDENCRGYQENATHLFVEINFSLCGSTMVENGDLIVQENKAKVVVSDVESESVERYRTHFYSMTCTFDRKLNVSTAYGFETEVASDINFARSDETTFNASIDIYDTSSYNTISPNPITVTLTEPLFIGIQGSNNNENFKMIVNQCYATATADRHSNNRYLFFDMRCPIDTTFEMTGNSNTHFNYRIDAFTFIAVRSSVFIHCNMYICLADSTASACQQTCHVRKRRAITQESDDEALPLKEVGVTTLEIVFEKKTLCSETTCPSNSRCWELYPAVCRCDEGYVFDEGTRRCHSERVLPIFGLQLDMEFISTYADPTSTDFLKLAANIEKQLTTSFRSRDKNIVGVKVISARKGSVVLDLLITYANTTRREDAFQTFVQHVMATDIPEEERLDIKIKREILPTTERQHTLEQQHASEKQPPVEEVRITNTLLLVATVLPALLIIVAVVVVLAVKRTQSRKKGEKDVQGFDNTSVSMENLS